MGGLGQCAWALRILRVQLCRWRCHAVPATGAAVRASCGGANIANLILHITRSSCREAVEKLSRKCREAVEKRKEVYYSVIQNLERVENDCLVAVATPRCREKLSRSAQRVFCMSRPSCREAVEKLSRSCREAVEKLSRKFMGYRLD